MIQTIEKYLLESVVAAALVMTIVTVTYVQQVTRVVGPATPADPWVTSCATRQGVPGTPRIQVLNPNGGEVYETGQQILVTWRSCNIATTTPVEVHLDWQVNSQGGDIVDSEVVTTIGAGSAHMILPTTLPAGASFGNYFKVSIDMDRSTVTDSSDATFTINDPSTQGEVVLNATGIYNAPYYMDADGLGGTLPHAFVVFDTGARTFKLGELWLSNRYSSSVKINSLNLQFSGHSDNTGLPVTFGNIKIYDGNTLVGSYAGNMILNFNSTTNDFTGSVSVPLNNFVLDGHPHGSTYLTIKADMPYTNGQTQTNFSFRVKAVPQAQLTTVSQQAVFSPAAVVGPLIRYDNN